MNKEHIEKHELSESIYMSGYGLLRQDCDNIAEQLYHEGYRRQSEGEWIEHIEKLDWCEDDVDVYYECSNCGTHDGGKPPYCPNCGAKMKGGKEE